MHSGCFGEDAWDINLEIRQRSQIDVHGGNNIRKVPNDIVQH
ncbi:hypothetical protein GCM10025794_25420 [Massilia kyonggiensis]